jgi:hypothetical protein
MPELALLEQTVLTGLIEKFVAPPENVGQSLFTRVGHPYSSAKWDVIQGNRYRGKPTLPNREGKLVGQMGIGTKTATLIYYREKKAFEPTTLRWLREPGELARNNAEAAVRRETVDLNNRLERLVESYCWDALKGTITINEVDVKATVDMGIPGTHKPTAAVEWDYIAGTDYTADIIGNIKAWKKLILQDSGNEATDIYLNSTVMEMVYKNKDLKTWFTDKHKNEYLSTGNVTALLGLDWHIFDGAYVNDADTVVPYLPDTHVMMLSKRGSPGPFLLLEGLSADEDAPTNHTGKFSKTWETKDPSGRFILLEYNFLPVLIYPENLIYGQVAS